MANFCAQCGVALSPTGQCPNCGKMYAPDADPHANDGFFERATKKLTEMTGENDFVDLRLRDLFSQVFKRHTLDDSEAVFIAGTKNTTPKESELSSSWPKPWLFSRVFTMFLLTFAFLYICFMFFENMNALPGMIFIGAVAVPFSLLVFFIEVNAPRNISFYEVLKVFFIGGGASLVITLILFTFISPGESLDFVGATIVGIVEEVAKFAVVAFFVKKNSEANYVLNGILLGAAVGAGFAAFETAGYILNFGLQGTVSDMMTVLWLRALLAPGGHVAWAAITGGALLLAKREKPFAFSQLRDKKFLAFFFLAVAMHAVWDMPIFIGIDFPVVQIALTVFAWVVLLVMVSAGLKEISRKASDARLRELQEASEAEIPETVPVAPMPKEAMAEVNL
ncbi:MAG: PrsW family glutamic-type intramembrane protease [Clostridia bacterium]|nr:PrsW family glutamic-type intramembrane protease [Clostridia bacterium]